VDFSPNRGAWGSVQALTQLQSLDIGDVMPYSHQSDDATGAAAGAALARLTQLTRLHINVSGLLAAAPHLATLPRLARIDIDRDLLRYDCWDVQAQLTRLTHVCIGVAQDAIEDEIIGSLKGDSALAALQLWGWVHDDMCTYPAALCQQMAALTALQRLEVTWVPIGWDSGQCARQLATLTTVTSLSLRNCCLQLSFLAYFGEAAKSSMAALVELGLSLNGLMSIPALTSRADLRLCCARCRSSRC
jgi:hypothetical protein